MKHKKLFVGIVLVATLIVVVMLIPFRLRKTAGRNGVAVELAKADKMQIDRETKGVDEDEAVRYAIRFTADRFRYAEHDELPQGKSELYRLCQILCCGMQLYLHEGTTLLESQTCRGAGLLAGNQRVRPLAGLGSPKVQRLCERP